MPEGFTKVFFVIVGTVLTIFGIFNIPSAVLSNTWSGFVLYTVLFLLGIWLLGWALKE
ncbi:MAG: hypothetical protein QXR48_03650 [Candidatus Woesearchaeota archaeon]